MTYNLTAIMTKANNLCKIYGLSKSTALTKSWAMAKLDILKDELFFLKMKDLHNEADRRRVNELHNAINGMKAAIYPTVTKTGKEYKGYGEDEYKSTIRYFERDGRTTHPRYLAAKAALEAGMVEYTYETLDINAYSAA